jgi:serine phosphatase RsbU (regulator of sigma subunit)/PAS domain-containing protein
MAGTTDGSAVPESLAALKSRSAALRRAAGSPRATPAVLLDAALTELDGAIAALTVAGNGTADEPHGGALAGQHSERRLLQAVFSQAPVPLFVVDAEATVRRANAAACDLLGVGVGYATGTALISLLEPADRAAVNSKLAAVIRTGEPAGVRARLLTSEGAVSCELSCSRLHVRGDDDRLLLAVIPDAALADSPHAAEPEGALSRRRAGSPRRAAGDPDIAAITRRTDLLAAAARLLLDNAAASESVILQRCARLLAGDLATWVVVDVRRRGTLTRHFVAGPAEPDAARLSPAVSAVSPGPGSAPAAVCATASTLLLSHIEDEQALGTDAEGVPLLAQLGATSLLAVPVTDGRRMFGALTLVRDSMTGHFSLADAGVAEQVADLLARAISARRMLTRQTETAAALRSSLLPPALKAVPGVDIAAAHMAPTRGREVGGDFYDVYPTPEGWGVAIGAVSGQGEDGAAATAAARHAIRVLAHWDADPAQVLRGANDIMLAEEFGSRFVTAGAAHLSWQERALRVVLGSAGHPGPVLLRPDGRAQLLTGGGVALGIFPDPEPAVQRLDLDQGDVLFFFTDGLTGARSPQQTYLEEILVDSLAPLAGLHAADIIAEMRKVVLDFSAGVLHDDLTMLALRAGVPPGG